MTNKILIITCPECKSDHVKRDETSDNYFCLECWTMINKRDVIVHMRPPRIKKQPHFVKTEADIFFTIDTFEAVAAKIRRLQVEYKRKAAEAIDNVNQELKLKVRDLLQTAFLNIAKINRESRENHDPNPLTAKPEEMRAKHWWNTIHLPSLKPIFLPKEKPPVKGGTIPLVLPVEPTKHETPQSAFLPPAHNWKDKIQKKTESPTTDWKSPAEKTAPQGVMVEPQTVIIIPPVVVSQPPEIPKVEPIIPPIQTMESQKNSPMPESIIPPIEIHNSVPVIPPKDGQMIQVENGVWKPEKEVLPIIKIIEHKREEPPKIIEQKQEESLKVENPKLEIKTQPENPMIGILMTSPLNEPEIKPKPISPATASKINAQKRKPGRPFKKST
jgi:hypothetical protein